MVADIGLLLGFLIAWGGIIGMFFAAYNRGPLDHDEASGFLTLTGVQFVTGIVCLWVLVGRNG